MKTITIDISNLDHIISHLNALKTSIDTKHLRLDKTDLYSFKQLYDSLNSIYLSSYPRS